MPQHFHEDRAFYGTSTHFGNTGPHSLTRTSPTSCFPEPRSPGGPCPMPASLFFLHLPAGPYLAGGPNCFGPRMPKLALCVGILRAAGRAQNWSQGFLWSLGGAGASAAGRGLPGLRWQGCLPSQRVLRHCLLRVIPSDGCPLHKLRATLGALKKSVSSPKSANKQGCPYILGAQILV